MVVVLTLFEKIGKWYLFWGLDFVQVHYRFQNYRLGKFWDETCYTFQDIHFENSLPYVSVNIRNKIY